LRSIPFDQFVSVALFFLFGGFAVETKSGRDGADKCISTDPGVTIGAPGLPQQNVENPTSPKIGQK